MLGYSSNQVVPILRTTNQLRIANFPVNKALSVGIKYNICSRRTFITNSKLAQNDFGTSTSQDEIQHFKQLAPSWWDSNGSQRVLHLMNLGRMDFIQHTIGKTVNISNPATYIPGFNYEEFLPSDISKKINEELDSEVEKALVSTKKTVLDIGCGGGILAESMARLPYVKNVTGIDLTPEVIQIAKDHLKYDPSIQNKVSYKLEALDKVEGTYDIVTCFEMLEHVDVPSEILRHAWNKVNANGLLFVSTINRDFISWFTTIFMAEHVLNIVPKGTHHLSKFINSKEIIEWFKENENGRYEVLDLKGTMYVPTNGWIEHDCADIGNYFLAIRRLQ